MMVGVCPEAGLEISSSLHEMLRCMDQGTEESCRRFAELFTETAELRIPLVQVTKKGTAELQNLCKFLHAKFSPCTHWEGNIVLKTCEDGSISNRSYWQAVKDGECISVGIHEDEFVKIENLWKCRKRIIRHIWTREAGNIKK